MDIIKDLKNFRSNVDIYDPIADKQEIKNEFNINILDNPKENYYDLVVIAVGHQVFTELGAKKIRIWCNSSGSIMDLKNTLPKHEADITL